MNEEKHKPIIETLTNTAAIVLSTFGTSEVIKGNYTGMLIILFAMVLEFFKYYGRSKKLW